MCISVVTSNVSPLAGINIIVLELCACCANISVSVDEPLTKTTRLGLNCAKIFCKDSPSDLPSKSM